MKTYLRILNYVKPYWKYIGISVVCTIMYALLNGVSVYLTIPLLDTLFQQKQKAATVTTTSPAASILPDWVLKIGNDISQEFNKLILSGDKIDALDKNLFCCFHSPSFKKYFRIPAGIFPCAR